MTLLALIVALLLEQLRPFPVHTLLDAPMHRLSALLVRRFDAGAPLVARVLWVVSMGLCGLAALFAHDLLRALHPVLALAFDVAVLYVTIGFRQESHYFSDIHLALQTGELDHARRIGEQWRGISLADCGEGELARLAIERALVAAHRNVFGPAFWFVLLPGPAGAVIYRLVQGFAQAWSRSAPESDFARTARLVGGALDWLPVRLTALGYSIAGNFEDAAYCWRTQARQWPDPIEGILVASGAGALGVRLGLPVRLGGGEVDRPEMGTGEEAGAEFMQSTVGLVWRTLVLCLLLLALLGIAGWVGG